MNKTGKSSPKVMSPCKEADDTEVKDQKESSPLTVDQTENITFLGDQPQMQNFSLLPLQTTENMNFSSNWIMPQFCMTPLCFYTKF